jgi:hypothetical protein
MYFFLKSLLLLYCVLRVLAVESVAAAVLLLYLPQDVEDLVHHVRKAQGAASDVTLHTVTSEGHDLLGGKQGLGLVPQLVRWMVLEAENKEWEEEEGVVASVSLGYISDHVKVM